MPKEILELNHDDVVQALRYWALQTKDWRGCRVTVTAHAEDRDGPRTSPAYVTARIERDDPPGHCDPF